MKTVRVVTGSLDFEGAVRARRDSRGFFERRLARMGEDAHWPAFRVGRFGAAHATRERHGFAGCHRRPGICLQAEFAAPAAVERARRFLGRASGDSASRRAPATVGVAQVTAVASTGASNARVRRGARDTSSFLLGSSRSLARRVSAGLGRSFNPAVRSISFGHVRHCGQHGRSPGAGRPAMCGRSAHRGPDDEGFHADERRPGSRSACARLSIMDVEGGHQPLCNEDGSVWVVCNGEIYNHPELREQLAARGHRFATALRHRGPRPPLRGVRRRRSSHALEGMFAFALWDAPRARLLLGARPLRREAAVPARARRRAAVRLRADGAAARSSRELRRARPGRDRRVLRVRLRAGARHDRARRAPAAAGPPAELGARRGYAERARLVAAAAERGASRASRFEAVARGGARAVRAARCAARMIADVPLGVFLSGGVDSTLVAAAAARASSRRRCRPSRSATTSGAVQRDARGARDGRRAARLRAPRGDARRRPTSPSARRALLARTRPAARRPRARAAARALASSRGRA